MNRRQKSIGYYTVLAALIGAAATIGGIFIEDYLSNKKIKEESIVKSDQNNISFFNEYFPLKSGNRWFYQMFDKRGDLYEGSATKTEIYIDNEDFVIEEKKPYKKFFGIEKYNTKDGLSREVTLKIDNKGNIFEETYFYSDDVIHLVLPNNLNYTYWTQDKFEFSLITGINSVKLENGKIFKNCILVITKLDGKYSERIYYSKGIGPIKIQDFRNGELFLSKCLMDFETS